MPAGLRSAHHLSRGTWGRIVVFQGQLRFVARTNPVTDVVVQPGCAQAIPPDIDHQVQPLGPVRFSIDFFSIPRRNRDVVTLTSEVSAD
jgi:ferredoxin